MLKKSFPMSFLLCVSAPLRLCVKSFLLSFSTALACFLVPFLIVSACIGGGSDPDGLRPTPPGGGPRVVFDPMAEPTPEIPFPTDLVTVMDEDSATGRRLNIRALAPTSFERSMRREMNRLDGFGTFAPITLSFDEPLDLNTVAPENIKLINVDPRSPGYGESVPLDLPAGGVKSSDSMKSSYPLEITPWAFPPHSPHAGARQILFNTDFGDVGDPDFVDFYERETNTLILRMLVPLRERTEYAVVLTEGLRGEGGEPVRSPFSYIHHASQREGVGRAVPFLQSMGVPLEQVAFAWTFTTQSVTRDLEAIADGLEGKGPLGWLREAYPPEIVRVADMETCLDRYFCLADPEGNNPCRDNRWIVQAELFDYFVSLAVGASPELIRAFGILLMGIDLGADATLEMPLANIDYFVFGRFRSPNFQHPEDELFHLDVPSGGAWTDEAEVPFFIAIPRPTADHRPPFPVVIHAHGNPSFRWEAITVANKWAEHGYATVCMDAPRHSPIVSIRDVQIILDSLTASLGEDLCGSSGNPLCLALWDALITGMLDWLGEPVVDWIACFLFGACDGKSGNETFDEALEALLSTGLLAQLLVEGRAIDVDGDGNTDHGLLFTADLFKGRDRIRQTVVDHMQLLQTLMALDQDRVPLAVPFPDLASDEEIMPNLMAGDFNADGILDLGGRSAWIHGPGGRPLMAVGDQRYFRTGMSFGGITTAILMGVEPDVRTAAFAVPAGGLTDVLLRSDLRAVVDPIFHQVLGPIVVGEPTPCSAAGRLKLFFIRRGKKEIVRDITSESILDSTMPEPIDELEVPVGGDILIQNLANGEQELVRPGTCGPESPYPGKWGCFSQGIASDKGDPVLIVSRDGEGREVDRIRTHAISDGLGLDRNSPEFRRFGNLGQTAMDKGDPINYAPHWFLDPLPGRPAKNILLEAVPGDMFVPVNTQVALARAGGLMGGKSNVCDGRPATLDECPAEWDALARDCDCVNMHWMEKEVMIGFYPRYDVDGVSPTCSQIHTTEPIDNRGKGAGFSMVRFPFSDVWVDYPYGEPTNRGMHWYLAFSNPDLPINWAMYSQNRMADFFDHDGYSQVWPPEAPPKPDCPCPVTEETCPWLP